MQISCTDSMHTHTRRIPTSERAEPTSVSIQFAHHISRGDWSADTSATRPTPFSCCIYPSGGFAHGDRSAKTDPSNFRLSLLLSPPPTPLTLCGAETRPSRRGAPPSLFLLLSLSPSLFIFLSFHLHKPYIFN